MNKSLFDYSAKIFILDSSSSVRLLIGDALKSIGFEHTTGLAGLAELLEVLETEHADLVITHCADSDELDMLSVMNTCLRDPNLKHIRFMGVFDEKEKDQYAEAAYSLGLLWHFDRPVNKNTLTTDCQFLSDMLQFKSESILAATKIRPILKAKKSFELLLKLDRTIFESSPGNSTSALNYAESLALNDITDKASSLLNQLETLNPEILQKITEMRKTLKIEKSEGITQSLDLFNLKSVLVVDSDETVQKQLILLFSELGVEEIKVADNGETALELLSSSPAPSIIIMEWRLAKYPAPFLLQRFVSETSVPIVIASSLLQNEDAPLLKEMGVHLVIEKPINQDEMRKKIIWLINREYFSQEADAIQQKAIRLLRVGKLEEAHLLIDKLLNEPQTSDLIKRNVLAHLRFSEKNYEECRDLCLVILAESKNSLPITNLLGKAFMQLKEYKLAIKCLEKAQSLSPKNIERLCNIAETKNECGDTEGARQALEHAKDQDPKNQIISQTELTMAVQNKDYDIAKSLFQSMHNFNENVARLNNQAVAFVKLERWDDGIQFYHDTIASIPSTKSKIKSLIYYNLALAQIKIDQLDQAIAALDQALVDPYQKIAQKAESLKHRLQQAMEKGQAFTLINDGSYVEESSPTSSTPTTSHKNQKDFLPYPGDAGCFLIYTPDLDTEQHARLQKALNLKITFKKRDQISRHETAIKTNKKAG